MSDSITFHRIWWSGQRVWLVRRAGDILGYVWPDEERSRWCFLKRFGGASPYLFPTRKRAALELMQAVRPT